MIGAPVLQSQAVRLDSLQLLRAIAAFAVVLFHLGVGLVDDFGLFTKNPFELGANGVDMFFVISGFIICYASMGTTSATQFMKKRVFRILPLYYALTLGVFMIALVAPQLLNSTEANGWHLLKSLAFIPYEKANGLIQPLLFLGWTLNFEMFFYVTFALLIGRSNREMWVAVVIVAIATLGAVIDFHHVVPDFFSRSIILNFVWGVGVFMLYQRVPGFVAKARWWWILATGFIAIQLVWKLPLEREFSIGLPSAAILLSALSFREMTGWSGAFAKLVGDASYSLYLIHPYVIQACIKIVIPLIGGGLVAVSSVSIISIVGATIAAIILFKLIELPSNQWLRSKFLDQRAA